MCSHRLGAVASWGSPKGLAPDFAQEECWALRQGKVYSIFDDRHHLFCGHVHADTSICYLCTPISAQGSILGLLHIQQDRENDTEAGKRQEAMVGLARTFTDNLGLALVNLQLQDKLRDQSIRDPLTGLYNRRFMEEFANQEILKIRRYKSPHSLGVIIIDIDHFKKFNDTHGHDAGDQVLKEVAGFFKLSCRDSDIVCRYGGEEFLILMPVPGIEIAEKKANDLCKGVPEQVRVVCRGETLSVTISVGVAAFPSHGSSVDAVTKAADGALYEAKRAGRNRVVVAPAPAGENRP